MAICVEESGIGIDIGIEIINEPIYRYILYIGSFIDMNNYTR